jgi:hypothetical protein
MVALRVCSGNAASGFPARASGPAKERFALTGLYMLTLSCVKREVLETLSIPSVAIKRPEANVAVQVRLMAFPLALMMFSLVTDTRLAKSLVQSVCLSHVCSPRSTVQVSHSLCRRPGSPAPWL